VAIETLLEVMAGLIVEALILVTISIYVVTYYFRVVYIMIGLRGNRPGGSAELLGINVIMAIADLVGGVEDDVRIVLRGSLSGI